MTIYNRTIDDAASVHDDAPALRFYRMTACVYLRATSLEGAMAKLREQFASLGTEDTSTVFAGGTVTVEVVSNESEVMH